MFDLRSPFRLRREAGVRSISQSAQSVRRLRVRLAAGLGALVLAAMAGGLLLFPAQTASSAQGSVTVFSAKSATPDWSATLTVGVSGRGSETTHGFSIFRGGMGTLSASTFDEGDQSIEVVAMLLSNGFLAFNLMPQPSEDFVLTAHGTEFASADASLVKGTRITSYVWATTQVWAEDDTVALSLSWVAAAAEPVAVAGTLTDSAVVVPETVSEAPAKPQGLRLISVSHHAVELRWNDPQNTSVTGYQILRRLRDVYEVGRFDIIVEDTGSNAVKFTDSTVEASTRYVYRVKAINAHGLSPQSGYLRANTQAVPPPAPAPTGLSVSTTRTVATLSWDDPADASITGYRITRRDRDVDDSEYSEIMADNGSGTSYEDSGLSTGGKYAWQVIALRGEIVGVPATIEGDMVGPPSAPTGLTVSVTTTSATLSWDDPNDPNVTGYKITRRDRAVDGSAFAVIAADNGSGTSFVDTGVSAGRRYAWQVMALHEELASEPTVVAADLPSAPDQPTGLSATATASAVTLSWDDPDDSSLTGYRILRRERDVDPSETLIVNNNTGSTTTSFVDNTVAADSKYAYWIRALDGSGLSPDSDEVEIDTPSAVKTVTEVVAPDAPTHLTATVAAGGGTVELTWYHAQWESIAGYRVQRRDRDVDPADTYTTVVENTGDAGLGWIDTDVSFGDKYAYQVIALLNDTASDASTAVEIDMPVISVDLGDITAHGSTGDPSHSADEDVYYSFTLTDVRAVTLSLSWAPTVDIHLYSSEALLLASAEYVEEGLELLSQVLRAGEYVIRLELLSGMSETAFGFHYSVSGNISESDTVEFSHDSQTLGRAQVGDTITGRHDALDDNVGGSSGDDWVGVELDKGVRYAVVVRSRDPSTIWNVLTWQTSDVQHDYEHADGTEYVMHGLNRENVDVGYQEAILTPRRSGLFFFRVSTSPYYNERWKGTEPYTFTVVRVQDDFRETRRRDDQGRAYAAWEIGPGQHGRVEVGGSMLGRIDWVRWSEDYDIEYNHDRLWQGGDTDWIAVDLTAGRVYQVDIESVIVPGSQVGPWPDPNLYTIVLPGPRISVFNSADDEDSGDGRNARALYRASTSGTHYLIVSPDASSRYNRFLGDYQVSVTDVTPTAPDLPNNTTTTARLSVDGTKVDGYFEKSSDHDWYAVAMEAGKSYQLRAHGTFGRDHIIDEVVGIGGIRFGEEFKPLPGTRWDGRYWHHRTMEIVFTPTRTGDYYIDLGHNACCGSDVRMIGPYEVSVTEVESLDADSFAEITTKSATVDQSIRGTVKFPPNDSDAWFSVELEAGTEYETALSNSGEVFRRAIYKSDGTIIAGSNTGTFTPKEAATYYVRIGGQPGHGTRSFSLTIQEPPEDPAAVLKTPEETLWESFDSANAVSLTLGETTDASIETAEAEHDWFQLDLVGGEGKTYYLDLANAANGGNAYTLGLPYLRAVYDSDGNALSHDRDGGGATSSYEFQPIEDATYYVVVRSREDFTSNSRGTGTYGVRVVDTTPPSDGDLPHDPSTTAVLDVGGSVIGEIDAEGDVDWYNVTLVSGTTYQIDMKGKSSGQWVLVDGAPAFVTLGTLVDPKLLGVYGGDSILIAGSDSEVNGAGKDSRIASFTPSTDGTYYIAAGSEAAWTGTFQLSIVTVE